MPENDPLPLLVVEDEEIHRDLVAERLSESDQAFRLVFAHSCQEALTKLATEPFQCVLLDHHLPDGTGADLLMHAQYQLMTTPVVAFSTSADPDVALAGFRGGCVEFISKRDAFKGGVLARTICEAVQGFKVRAAIEQAGSSADLVRAAGQLLEFDDQTPITVEPTVEGRLQLIYETAVRTMDDGVLLVERRRRVVYSNPGFRRLLGLTNVDNLPGHPLTTVDEVFSPAAIEVFRTRQSKRDRYELTLRSVAGDDVPVLVSETPLGDHGVLCTVSDLREIKSQQRDLEEKNRKLSELYDMGNRFVDNVSHEFRTPLTVIKGYTEVIAQEMAGPVTDEQRGYFQTILDRTQDLAQMVDDLLDTSKLRARSLRVDRRAHQVQDLLKAVRPAIAQKAKANRIDVREEIDGELPLIYADLEKVGRIILNLVVNAIKFSPEESEVVIWARRQSNDDVMIGVSDHGPGISKANLSAIFERFQQVGDPQRSSTKGFGLGLNIANELVALNLGTMDVETELGQGSTFSFTLPIDDRAVVLRRLLERMRETGDDSSTLALLRVTSPRVAGDTGALYAHLACNTYPMDLIFEETESILLLGASTVPEEWQRRLESTAARADEVAAAAQRPMFDVSVVGSWAYSKQNDRAYSDLIRILNGEGGACPARS